MLLWFQKPDLSFPFVLSTDTVSGDIPTEVEMTTQDVLPIGAPGGICLPRQLGFTTQVFTVARDHDSEAEAREFVLFRSAEIPHEEGMALRLLSYNGLTDWYLPDCCVTSISGLPNGLESKITYTIRGGLWQPTNPYLS